MADLTDMLHGWTRTVYGFGCAFIHLSHVHDYQTREPLDQIPETEKSVILDHLRYYHGGQNGSAPRFSDIVPLLQLTIVPEAAPARARNRIKLMEFL